MDFSEIKQKNTKLRPYQVEMKQNVFKEWQNGNKSVMMQMPTGTGKTMLFASIIKDLWDNSYDKRNMKRFLVLVHRKELVEQIQETLYKKYGLAHGTIQSGKRDDDLFHIQVAMVRTLAKEKRLNKWKDNEFDFIICDEAHHFLADSYQGMQTEEVDEEWETNWFDLKYHKKGMKNIWETDILKIILKSYVAIRTAPPSSTYDENGQLSFAADMREYYDEKYYNGNWVELNIIAK